MRQPFTDGMREERGAVLVISLLVMTLLVVQGLAFLATARTEGTIASNFSNQTRTCYAAEAGLESGLVDLRAGPASTLTPTDANSRPSRPRH